MKKKGILILLLQLIYWVHLFAQTTFFELKWDSTKQYPSVDFEKMLHQLDSDSIRIEIDSIYCLNNPRFMVQSNQSIYQKMIHDSVFFNAGYARTTSIRYLKWKYQKIFIEEWFFNNAKRALHASHLFNKYCRSEYGLPFPSEGDSLTYYFWYRKGKQFYVVYSFDVNLENELMKKVITTVKAL
jgi:hypothetical protein